MKVCVFCSCSEGISPMLISEMENLGEALAQDGHEVIYGGSAPGCMGALKRGVKRAGGRIIGVIAEMEFMDGIVEDDLDERHVTSTLMERKDRMIQLADAMVVFPGGLGTLDEAFEAMALKSIGTLKKPLIFYNFLGVWSPLIEALELLRQQRLVRVPLEQVFRVVDKPEELREHLRNAI